MFSVNLIWVIFFSWLSRLKGLTQEAFLGHNNAPQCPSGYGAVCLTDELIFISILEMAQLEPNPLNAERKKLQSHRTQSLVLLHLHGCDVCVSRLLPTPCLFQCMRNPTLLQRTGSAIRVFCDIQDNVWLLRWICRCWRHHGQLLGGKETPHPHHFW